MKLINRSIICTAVVLLLLAASGSSYAAGREKFSSHKDTTDMFAALKFRNIGPAIAGGRVSSVVGIPGQPNIYYAGAAGGGVFKTTDGGYSWKAIFAKEPVSSIGAIALAPSNPNLVWVGTGEANMRNDIIDGRGVYYSPDAGKTWQCMGLKDAGQISKIVIDPSDPNIVFVAAIGHAWAPNKDRGLFKTTDGGKTWKKVLFVNDTTGVNDVVFEPDNPNVMLAATWQVIRHPWQLIDGGDGSGIYESKDGGNTWTKLSKGLPKGLLGRIAFATSLSNPEHVYALIEAKHGMLWDSHDFGQHWRMVSNNHELDVRPFYFTKMAVAPDNDEKIYFLSFLITESTDGGKTVKSINRGIHVDHHAIWIDPKNPDRIIEGNDGGVYQSLTGGKNWHYFDNMPIEQFYQVAADTNIAYNLGGGLQDNNAWYGPSYNLKGGSIDGSNWYVVAGGDGEYVVPAPSDPHIIYSESQDGYLNRLDTRTGFKRHIRPYFFDAPDMPPSKLKYRFNWTTPIAVGFHDADEVYLGANVLFKSTDGGKNWNTISPDLTRDDKSKEIASGGPINLDMSGAETYCTILSIGLSRQNDKVIWVGTDDGQVQVTKDGGKNWTNVTKNIPNLPSWGRVYQIEVSPFSPAKCYIAVDLHMLDNRKPYVYKTDDYGKTWKEITKGLPEDEPAHVVREDPNEKGFLMLGNETGLYYSNNDGENWTRLKSNFPTAPVWDLKFVKQTHDIAVATHGRGLFILDNITPLEEMSKKTEENEFTLFGVRPVYMFHIWYRGGFGEPGRYSSPNPPSGAVIDYFLKSKLKHEKGKKDTVSVPVMIKITDSNGAAVDTLHGTTHEGLNRLEWNLHYQGPEPLVSDTTGGKHHYTHNGPVVLPGKYNLAVTVEGKTYTKTINVNPDPRYKFDYDAAKEQQSAEMKVKDEISSMNQLLNRIDDIHKQSENIRRTIRITTGKASGPEEEYNSLISMLHSIDSSLTVVKDTLEQTKAQKGVGEDDIHYFTRFNSHLYSLMYTISGDYDTAPSTVALEMMPKLRAELQGYINSFNNVLSVKAVAYNKAAAAAGVPILFTGKPIELK